MARDNRRVFLTDAPTAQSMMTRKHLTRQEFAKRLYRLILEKGWTQSEFARRADILRDSVSNYVRGNNLPDGPNLKKMAKALGVSEADLLPNIDEEAIDQDLNPALEVRASGDNPTRVWIRLNREVSSTTMVKIMQVLAEEDVIAQPKRANAR